MIATTGPLLQAVDRTCAIKQPLALKNGLKIHTALCNIRIPVSQKERIMSNTNFTVAIPDDLLTAAKVMAAKSGTSLNSIIRNLLDGFVNNESTPLSGNYEILLKYSLGQVAAKKVIKNLHLENVNELNALTIQAGFPIPRVSLQENEDMQKRFSQMLDRANA